MDKGSLEPLDSFGDVAAEDDPVLNYFIATDAVKQIEGGKVFLVLGRKGSGKTALVRYFAEGARMKATKALNLKGYPWKIHASLIVKGASEIETYVSSWRYLLALEFALLSYRAANHPETPAGKSFARFLTDNYGGVDPALNDVLKPSCLRLSEASFEPQILGNKLGKIQFDRESSSRDLGSELNPLSDLLLKSAQTIAVQSKQAPLSVQIDELDQGLSTLDDQRKGMLTGLILACRDICRIMKDAPVPLRPVVYLRTDLWDEISFSDKNKISQTSALRLEWHGDSLLNLVNARLAAKLGEKTQWETISSDDLMRGSQTKWNHILARTFLRPRDVISFLNAALTVAKKRTETPLVFTNEDITGARVGYSAYLKSELDDELLAHWPKWEEALRACSSLTTITFRREDFTNAYNTWRSEGNDKGADEALHTLFNYSVIGYERRSGYGGQSWVFRYSHPEAGWDNASTVFKVHLGLKEFAKLREERVSAWE